MEYAAHLYRKRRHRRMRIRKNETACMRQAIIRKQVTGLRRMAKKKSYGRKLCPPPAGRRIKEQKVTGAARMLKKNTGGQGLGKTRKKGCGYNRAQHDGQ